MPKVLNVKQVMERCGVSRRTVYHWMDHGKVKFIRQAGGRRFILADSLWKTGNVPAGDDVTRPAKEI